MMVTATLLRRIKGQETVYLYKNEIISKSQFNELSKSADHGTASIYEIRYTKPVEGQAIITISEYIPMGIPISIKLDHLKTLVEPSSEDNAKEIEDLEQRLKGGHVWDIEIHQFPEYAFKIVGDLISKYSESK